MEYMEAVKQNRLEKTSRKDFADFLQSHHPNLRLGQAFLNVFYPWIVDPEVFYINGSRSETIDLIAEKYVLDYL